MAYSPPDWGKILLDLEYWQQTSIANRSIYEMPDWLLLQYYQEIAKREMIRVNAYSVTVAKIGAGFNKDIKVTDMLPYDLQDPPPKLSATTIKTILANKNELPLEMLALLAHNSLIPENVLF